MNIIIDLLRRLFSKTPKFFTYAKWILAVIAIITGLPAFLESSGVVLPDGINAIADKVIAIAAAVGAIISQLTVTEDKVKDLSIK